MGQQAWIMMGGLPMHATAAQRYAVWKLKDNLALQRTRRAKDWATWEVCLLLSAGWRTQSHGAKMQRTRRLLDALQKHGILRSKIKGADRRWRFDPKWSRRNADPAR